MTRRLLLLSALLVLALPGSGWGHIVVADNHDRTIAVQLSADSKVRQVVVTVAYRLEVNEETAVFIDLPAVEDRLNLSEFRNQRERFFQEFTRCYGPVLARNLTARVDGKRLEFTVVRGVHRLRDEQNKVLGHLRCDFVFQARTELGQATEHQFLFREGNYQDVDKGLILLSFSSKPPLRIRTQTAPDAALQTRPTSWLAPEDDARLRTVKAVFTLPSPAVPVQADHVTVARATETSQEKEPLPEEEKTEPASEEADTGRWTLTSWFFSDYGLVVLLLGAACLGVLHAILPGHGKTLVAAYLIGEQGTVWHAVLLGLITTLAHTGVVLILAVVLSLSFPNGITADTRRGVQTGLGLVSGMIIVCLGFWLFLRRLAGRADHYHFGGHGHHHNHHHHGGDHDPADHYHDEHGHAHPLPPAVRLGGWQGLVALGISGGIVPCWDAIALLVAAIGANLLWLALPVLLAFSAGLAGVLVLIGILVVKVKGFAGSRSRWEKSWLFRSLPFLSAAAVTLMGFWLCYQSARGQ